MITKESLALKVLEMEEVIKMHEKSYKNIHGLLYCMGGPLNDNALQYTNKQLKTFFRISEELIFNLEKGN